MIERLKYWLFQRGKDCYHCCLRCEYFDICRWDVMTGKTAEQEQTVEGAENHYIALRGGRRK